MKKIVLKNNFKLIYKHSESNLTSICISINAGAGVEREKLGVAHAVEHMVYKGTKKRSELKINEELSNFFGFQNAMTNYPYVIYYGTLLKEDFEKGIELFSDIILNPIFSKEGFEEEINVIKEELEEWDEELEQFCQDKLFLNSFDSRRIKRPIIGTRESLESMTLDDIKRFYNENYFPENASIVVISSLDFNVVESIIKKYFKGWQNTNEKCQGKTPNTQKEKLQPIFVERYEEPKREIFYNERHGTKTSKIQIVCPIDNLNEEEMKALRIFNQYFGEGVSSILYDRLRTKYGLVYDVITKISHENYIKLYKITFSTSKDNVEKTLDLVKKCISKLEIFEKTVQKKDIEQLAKNFKLKRLFREEQSIILAKELSTYDTMFKDYRLYVNETEKLGEITKEKVFSVGKKVLKNLTVQVVY